MEPLSDDPLRCFREFGRKCGADTQSISGIGTNGPEFFLEDQENLGQDDETYDAVCNASVFAHTQNWQKVVDEV